MDPQATWAQLIEAYGGSTTKDWEKIGEIADSLLHWVKRDGSTPYKPERGRYHLYVSFACPWAHRTIILRKLKGLEETIGVIVRQWVAQMNPECEACHVIPPCC